MFRIGFFFLLIGVLNAFSAFSQNKQKIKADNYFGFQYKPLIPVSVVGDRPFDIGEGPFTSTVRPRLGYTYGGIIRIGITELLAIETGISYTKRRFSIDYAVPDSSLAASDGLSYINFDIPVNFLVYIKLSNKFYMNSSLGTSLIYYPSNVRTVINPEGIHQFIFEGRRLSFFSADVNANIGFELRTEKNGVFYIGVSGKVPLTPVLRIATEYRYDTEKFVAFSEIQGAQVSLDFKYFIPYIKTKGPQFKGGPIEQ
jgi:hypothetical protein